MRGGRLAACSTGDLLTDLFLTSASGIIILGTSVVGLKAAYCCLISDPPGLLASGDATRGGDAGKLSFARGFNGLRGVPMGSGNWTGDRVLSGDRDSPRIGLDVDMRCAFCRRPSPSPFFPFVPALDDVYREPLSFPYARLELRTLAPSVMKVTGRYGS